MFTISEQPLVSIILHTYNRAGFILDTIQSIRQQTYQKWELIIIDDASDDNTKELVQSIQDDRIRLYTINRTGISGRIKNIGLEKANGEVLAFTDSDDLWASTKLEKQLKALEEYPEAGFCMTGGYNFRTVDEPLEYFYKQRDGIRYDDLFIPFFKSEVAATLQTLICKKQCLRVSGPFKDLELSHVHFIVDLAFHFKGVLLYEPLFFRRLHDSNFSTINRIKRHYDGIEMIKHYKAVLPKNIFARSLFRSYTHFGEEYLKSSKRLKAMQQFLLAWKYRPLSIVPIKKITKSVIRFF